MGSDASKGPPPTINQSPVPVTGPGSDYVPAGFPAPASPPGGDDANYATMDKLVFIGTYGKISCIDRSGEKPVVKWLEELKGCGHNMVHIFLSTRAGLLFAVTNGNIFCFEALTGKKVWHEKPSSQHGWTESDLMTLMLSYEGGLLISAASGVVIAFNATNGQIIWERKLDVVGKYDSFALKQHKGLLYVGNEGCISALSMSNGALVWRVVLKDLKYSGWGPISLVAGTFNAGGYASDVLFVGTHGYFATFDGNTGAPRGQVVVVEPSEISRMGPEYGNVSLLVDHRTNKLYCATVGQLKCYGVDTLQPIWKCGLSGMGYASGHSLLLAGEHLLVGMNGKVTLVNTANGSQFWNSSLPGCGYNLITLSTVTDPNIFVCASSGKLYSVSMVTGQLIWKDDLKGMGNSKISVSTTTFNTDFNSTTLPQTIEMDRKAAEIRKNQHH